MKNQLNKIFTLIIIFLFFSFSKSYSIDGVNELTDAINEAKEEFNNLSESSNEQSKIIDEAIKEIDKATEFVQEAIDNNNTEDAIKTLEFIERSLTDVESIIPQEFGSDMSNIDTSAIEKEDMDTITDITKQMNVAKEKKLNEFMSDLVDLNQKGIDTISISEKLNNLGIDTVQISLDISEGQNIETWTKEQWAESYNGSILTTDGTDVVDKEISAEVVDLEQKLEANNIAIIDKRSSLAELQTQIDPISNQITDLKTQKTNLLAKYNEEILKQSSTILSDEEINKSKELADQFNNELSNITNQISIAEQQSSSLQQQVQDLNIELTNEIANKSQLQNSIKDLNNQLSANQDILSKKTLELDQLKNTDLNKKINSLNEQLEYASRERDFIQTDFERSIDLEVDAVAMYHSALGNIDSKNFEDEVDFSMREVGVILDSDPKKYRAFELEKYATYAGFSDDYIQQGIEAINNDDWDRQKDLYKEVAKKLSKNPEWTVDIPSDAEINVMIEEDKAIQAAAQASMEVEKIKSAWNAKINEQAKEYQPLAGLNVTAIKYAALRSNTSEAKMLSEEVDKILSSDNELANLSATLQEKQKQLSEIQELQRLKNEQIEKQIKPLREQLSNDYAKMNDLNQELLSKMNEKTIYINSIGGYAVLQRDKGNANYGDWVKNITNLDEQINNINTQAQDQMMEANKISSEIYKIQMDNSTPNTEINNWINLQREVGSLASQKVIKENQVLSQARTALVAQVEEAQKRINEIYSQESPDLKAVEEKVESILKKVPTFEADAENLAGLDATSLRAKLIDIANGNNNESEALKAARDAVAKIGEAPVGNLTGPYWQMTNVKAAAIVRSKKYDWVDDYQYITATYEDPLSFNSAQREEIEGELKNLLSQDNIKLKTLNAKVSNLSNELNLTKEQSQNLAAEISNLENELSSLKSSEDAILTQIDDLSNQFNSTESLISEKTQNLASLQEQLNPISERMNELQSQRAELDTKLNNQLNTIASQVENQEQVSDEAKALKEQFESQIVELDNQLKNYENQSAEINTQLTSITSELNTLEAETPELANQIESLNQDLKNFENIKADLAMATAKKLGLTVNEKAIETVEIIDGKAIVSLKGTDIVKIVDQNMLVDQANSLIDPVVELSKNRKLYTANALNPALITPEFVEASKSIAGIDKLKVLTETTALDISGASTEQAAKVAAAKAKRVAAREDWNEAMASGDKAAAAAAEAAFMAARDAEAIADMAAADAVAKASVAAVAAKTAAASVASEAVQEVASVAQEAAQEVVQDVAASTRAAQEATLAALKEIEAMPGGTTWDAWRAQAAIEQVKAEMEGRDFKGQFGNSYEESMAEIERMENSGSSAVDCISAEGC